MISGLVVVGVGLGVVVLVIGLGVGLGGGDEGVVCGVGVVCSVLLLVMWKIVIVLIRCWVCFFRFLVVVVDFFIRVVFC